MKVGEIYCHIDAPSALFMFKKKEVALECKIDFLTYADEASIKLWMLRRLRPVDEVWFVPGNTLFMVLAIDGLTAQVLAGERIGWMYIG